MPVYTVHGPLADGTDVRSTTDRFVFVRDGFSFWAFVFGPVWLIYRRLWLALVGYIVLSIAVAVGLSWLHAGFGTRSLVMLLIAILMGLEAASLRRWTLSRGKWRLLDVVVADDEEAAERRFLATISSACFRNREARGERCHHRLWLGQPPLRRQGVRAGGAQHGGSGKDHRDAGSRRGVSRRSRGSAWRGCLRRLPQRARRARRHGRGSNGSRPRQGT